MTDKGNLRVILRELGECSSLHGVPRILSSRQIAVKLLWCFLLLGAISLFSVQLYGLCEEYYSYPTRTTVKLRYAPLYFPALTFCNMNPLKLEHLRRNSQLNSLYSGFQFSRWNKFSQWRTRFLTEFRNLPYEQRLEMGHQAQDFIIFAAFAENEIPYSQFLVTQSTVFGNCFTLDSDNLIARGSGYDNSLYLVLNIEKFEYLTKLSPAFGVKMVIHEKGSYPLPETEGLILNPKYETHIGLHMTHIKRLGGKYGDCTTGDEFVQKYGLNYTVSLCYSVCESVHIIQRCNCLSLPTLDVLEDMMNYTICDYHNETQRLCAQSVKDDIQNAILTCDDCKTHCNENIFTTTVSGRTWPHQTYLEDVLLKQSCRFNRTLPDGLCNLNFGQGVPLLSMDDYTYFSGNFLAIYVYFEDLNYEVISEEALYNTLRFLSDIGGAMGLYMGASLLTYVELLQVILELIMYLCNRTNSVATVNDKAAMGFVGGAANDKAAMRLEDCEDK